MLRLMWGTKTRTHGLVLLTATPMQVHPIEVFDLVEPPWPSTGMERTSLSAVLQ